MSGCLIRLAPAFSPRPGTILIDPSGNPASIASSPIASAVKHASSEGFKTHALPIAREAPKVRPMICIG